MKPVGVILAGGRGTRFGMPKCMVAVGGVPLVLIAARLLAPFCRYSIVAAPKEYAPRIRSMLKKECLSIRVVVGGGTRAESLERAISRVPVRGLVLVHNVANPFATPKEVRAVVSLAKKSGVAAPFHTCTPSAYLCSPSVLRVDRAQLRLTQTPQAISFSVLKKGLSIANRQGICLTDEMHAALLAGSTPAFTPANPANIKITTPADLPTYYAHGEDSHHFTTKNKKLMLGGIHIKGAPGLSGNSDADPVLHAIANALSSSMGGFSFSRVADPLCKKGITCSSAYLVPFLKKMQSLGMRIVSVSISIEAMRPKLEAHLPRMQRRIARLLSIRPSAIGITCHSGETLSSPGLGRGIRASVTLTVSA